MKRSVFLKNILLAPIAFQLPNLATAKVVKLTKLQKMLLYGQIHGEFDFMYDFPGMYGDIPKYCKAVWKDDDLWYNLLGGNTFFSMTAVCTYEKNGKNIGEEFVERYYEGMLKSTQISKLPDYHVEVPINKNATFKAIKI